MTISYLFVAAPVKKEIKLIKFKVLIQKQFNHRIKRWIFVDFADGVFNTNHVETMYPNYQVSMFWPVI